MIPLKAKHMQTISTLVICSNKQKYANKAVENTEAFTIMKKMPSGIYLTALVNRRNVIVPHIHLRAVTDRSSVGIEEKNV